MLVEGVRAVSEVLDSEAPVDFACVSPRLETLDAGVILRRRLEDAGDRRGFDVLEVDDDAMRAVADTEHPQGVVAVCPEPKHDLAGAVAGAGRILILDAVQDPGNVGTLMRSAVAFGFDLVLVLDGTADPWGTKAVRASAGMVFRLPVVRCSAADALDAISRAGIGLRIASSEGRVGSLPPEGPVALALGNEGAGVREDLRDAATEVVAVAMPGPAESLNVGIAGSILMSELAPVESVSKPPAAGGS